MTKQAFVNLTLDLDDDNKIINFTIDSNLYEPDRRLTLLDAYIDLAGKHGLGYADMGGELITEAKRVRQGKE